MDGAIVKTTLEEAGKAAAGQVIDNAIKGKDLTQGVAKEAIVAGITGHLKFSPNSPKTNQTAKELTAALKNGKKLSVKQTERLAQAKSEQLGNELVKRTTDYVAGSNNKIITNIIDEKKINKKRVIQPVKNKPKIWAILVGIIAITVSCVIGNSINDHRLVRKNGILINTPIIEISYGNKGGRSGSVKVDGKILSIYALDNNLEVGDSISVRYDKEKSLVVQEKYNNNYFTVYFLLDGILLILGVLMLYGGIAGKDFSS